MANKKDDITKDKDVKKILNEIDNQINAKKEEMLKEFTETMDKQIEVGVSKKLDQLEKKIVKGKNGKIIRRDIVIIILLAGLIYLAYCLYEIGYFNKDLSINPNVSISQNEENNTEPEEIIKPASYYIENYSYLVGNMQIPNSNEVYKNGITRETLTNDIKLKIAYKNLSEDLKQNSETVLTVSSEDILNSYVTVMGENEALEYTNFEYDNLKFLYYNGTFIADNTASSNTNVNINANTNVTDTNVISETVTPSLSTTVNYNIVNAYEKDGMLTLEVQYEAQPGIYRYIFEEKEGSYYFNRIER